MAPSVHKKLHKLIPSKNPAKYGLLLDIDGIVKKGFFTSLTCYGVLCAWRLAFCWKKVFKTINLSSFVHVLNDSGKGIINSQCYKKIRFCIIGWTNKTSDWGSSSYCSKVGSWHEIAGFFTNFHIGIISFNNKQIKIMWEKRWIGFG